MVSNRTLGKFATYGAIACISAVMWGRSVIQSRVSKSEYFQEAFKILRAHSGAVLMLGEPIKQLGFDLGDEKRNFCDGKIAQFEVNVKGPKDKGTMFFWADRVDNKWEVNRIELSVKNEPDKRLSVKKPVEASV